MPHKQNNAVKAKIYPKKTLKSKHFNITVTVANENTTSTFDNQQTAPASLVAIRCSKTHRLMDIMSTAGNTLLTVLTAQSQLPFYIKNNSETPSLMTAPRREGCLSVFSVHCCTSLSPLNVESIFCLSECVFLPHLLHFFLLLGCPMHHHTLHSLIPFQHQFPFSKFFFFLFNDPPDAIILPSCFSGGSE